MRTLACLAIASIATTATPAFAATAQADAASARAFVAALYHRYEHEKEFGVFGATNEPKFFDASTLALLRQDEKLLNGEEGAIGADYVCVCQDTAGMRATIDTVETPAPNHAKAQVTLRYLADSTTHGKATAHVDLDLAFENGGWRIHDIHPKDSESNDWGGLRDTLTKEIAELSAGH